MNLIPKPRMSRPHKDTYKHKQYRRKLNYLRFKLILCGGATYPYYTGFVGKRFHHIFNKWW